MQNLHVNQGRRSHDAPENKPRDVDRKLRKAGLVIGCIVVILYGHEILLALAISSLPTQSRPRAVASIDSPAAVSVLLSTIDEETEHGDFNLYVRRALEIDPNFANEALYGWVRNVGPGGPVTRLESAACNFVLQNPALVADFYWKVARGPNTNLHEMFADLPLKCGAFSSARDRARYIAFVRQKFSEDSFLSSRIESAVNKDN